jgi:glucosyl-dolichyl phosphate glucuronosyltransferase
MGEMISLSVIIPTRNRYKFLDGVLLSLTKQTYNAELFEVIVIDNGSTDNTKEIYESYKDRILNLQYHYDATPGLHVGRHLGLKVARSDILVYADDDIEAFPTWLEGITEAFQHKDVVLVGGKNLPKFEIEPPDWILEMWKKDQKGNRVLGHLSILDLGDEIKCVSPYQVFGCNFSIRKDILLEAGGFHPDAMPQDLIRYRGDGESHVSRYILEKGYITLYQPKASVYHLVPSSRLTEEYFSQRAYNQGISDSYTQLRDLHLGSNTGNQAHGFTYLYRRFKKMTIYELWNSAIKKLQHHISLNNEVPHKNIQDKIVLSYREGWEYHQRIVNEDSSLLKYILRNTYISEDFRQIELKSEDVCNC